jgi:hypothetical protein
MILLDRVQTAGGDVVALYGDDYTGGLVVEANAQRHTLPRGNAQLLAEKLGLFLERTAECPRCQHSRLEHFRLWTHGGHLNGCSHGTGEGWKLAAGLPCDCPGDPGDA